MVNINNSHSNVSIIKKSLWIVFAISAIGEIFLFPTWQNFAGCVVTMLSMILYFKVVFNIETIRRRPVSFIASLYPFLFMYLPLPATLLDGNPMSHDMLIPIQTYTLQFIFFCCTIIAFALADKWSKSHNGVYHLLKLGGYFKTPTNKQLWVLGAVGLFFKLFILNNQYGDKTLAGAGTLGMFSLFMYSPICIYFKGLLGVAPASKYEKQITWVYMIGLSVFLISTNSCSQMLSPFVIWVCGYIINSIYQKNVKWFSYKKIVFGIVGVLLVLGPATDMAYAMLLVRGERSDLDFSTLLQRSFEVFQDKELILQAKEMEKDLSEEAHGLSVSGWSESYVSSVFLSRLCNYRVADQSIYYAQQVGYGNNKMLELFETNILQTPPGPISRRLTDKEKDDYSFSSMDYLYFLKTGTGLGGYKVGGDVGLGLATFGYMFFPIMLIVYVVVFILFNSVARYSKGILSLSFITLMSIYFTYFLKFQFANGLIAQVSYILWGFWWTAFWYIFVYKIVRVIVK